MSTREHPTRAPRETPETDTRETPETLDPRREERDPVDEKIRALTYRSASLVTELLRRVDVEPRFVDELTLELETLGSARATIKNLIRELVAAGIITKTHRAHWREETVHVSPLGRAWILGAIDPTIYPIPTIVTEDTAEGPVLRWHKISNNGEPDTRSEEDHR